jgi:ElaB/YqjD/DUF883 family membrane-anchored ribosome-binding protein
VTSDANVRCHLHGTGSRALPAPPPPHQSFITLAVSTYPHNSMIVATSCGIVSAFLCGEKCNRQTLGGVGRVSYRLVSLGEMIGSLGADDPTPDAVLLDRRFAAALAASPVISCEVPLPPTMPPVKISQNGLPIPLPAKGGPYLFGKPKPPPELNTSSHVAGAESGDGGAAAPVVAAEEDPVAVAEVHFRVMTEVHQRSVQLGKLQNHAANLEVQLDELELEAKGLGLSEAGVEEEAHAVGGQKHEVEARLKRLEHETEHVLFSSAQLGHLQRRERVLRRDASDRVNLVRKQLGTANGSYHRASRRAIELRESRSEGRRLVEVVAASTAKRREMEASAMERARKQAEVAEQVASWSKQLRGDSLLRVRRRESERRSAAAAEAEKRCACLVRGLLTDRAPPASAAV